ncbi:MAG: NADH-quinone oxidoreductase subunit J [Chloroflexi bacterium]|nr:NADH-quinone oxidoreductase subunit J [Chloroflexota bacterium]
MGNPIIFLLLAIVAIGSGLGMLTSRNAVHSALYLVLNFATIGIFYIVLNAPFIAMVQITVYAGAIMVLFLFVIMLLGADQLQGITDVHGGERFHRAAAGLLAAVLLLTTALLIFQSEAPAATAPMLDSSPTALGLRLFAGYVFPFQVTGLLLLAAMIGVFIFGKIKKRGQDA